MTNLQNKQRNGVVGETAKKTVPHGVFPDPDDQDQKVKPAKPTRLTMGYSDVSR